MANQNNRSKPSSEEVTKTEPVMEETDSQETTANMAEPSIDTATVPQQSNMQTNLLVVLLIIISFFAGYLFNKVRQLEKGAATTAPTAQAGQAASPLTVDNLKKYAKDLKLDTKKFNTCLDSNKMADRVKSDSAEGSKVGVNGTPSFFINGKMLVGAQPFEAFKEVIDKEIAGTGSTNCYDYSENLQKMCSSEQDKSFDPNPKDIALTNEPARGNKSAKVTIVEFSDFECPFCERFYPTLKQIESTYPNDVKVYYKQFPLPFHPHAQKAAEASLCAMEQNKFWEMHNKLFELAQQQTQ
jgi:protein-disulfide isomerase